MQQLSVTIDGPSLVVTRGDGFVIESACVTGQAALSATELLAASLGSCVAASLVALLSRHHVNHDRLRIIVRAKGAALEHGFSLDIALPSLDEGLRLRCQRAALACPVRQALNTPVELHWQDS